MHCSPEPAAAYRKMVDENADEPAAFHLLEQMEQEINEKAKDFMADEQSFAYRMRLLESANGIKVRIVCSTNLAQS